MKSKKIIIFLSLSLSFIIFNIKSVVAVNNNVPDIVIDYVINLYSNDKNYDIIDKNSISVKKMFLEENINNYKNGNYPDIYSYIKDNDLVLVGLNLTNVSTRASTTKNLTKTFVHTVKFTPEKAVTFAVECYAIIRVNESTGVITSFSGPSITLKDPSGGGAVIEKLYDVSTSYSWGSSAHRSIDFTYKYGYERVEAGSYGTSATYKSPYYTQYIHGE